MALFIWFGSREMHKYHLIKLEKINIPKEVGGWGILDIKIFSLALLLKALWRGIFNEGIWGDIVNTKYLRQNPLKSGSGVETSE